MGKTEGCSQGCFCQFDVRCTCIDPTLSGKLVGLMSWRDFLAGRNLVTGDEDSLRTRGG